MGEIGVTGDGLSERQRREVGRPGVLDDLHDGQELVAERAVLGTCG
jgi:hypothetical protein